MRTSPWRRTPLSIGVLAAIGVAFIARADRGAPDPRAVVAPDRPALVDRRVDGAPTLARGLARRGGALARAGHARRLGARALLDPGSFAAPRDRDPAARAAARGRRRGAADRARSERRGRAMARTRLGIQLTFTIWGAIVATTFVSIPLVILAAEAGLRSLDPRLEGAAAAMGASRGYVLRRVTLPMLRPQLAAGLVLAWARALGEFGATITFAGNLAGRTQTLPLAVYQTRQTDPGAAILISLLLVALSLDRARRDARPDLRPMTLSVDVRVARGGACRSDADFEASDGRDGGAARPERRGEVDGRRLPGRASLDPDEGRIALDGDDVGRRGERADGRPPSDARSASCSRTACCSRTSPRRRTSRSRCGRAAQDRGRRARARDGALDAARVPGGAPGCPAGRALGRRGPTRRARARPDPRAAAPAARRADRLARRARPLGAPPADPIDPRGVRRRARADHA